MRINRKVQYSTGPQKLSGKLDWSIPTQSKKGLATYTEEDPVIAKTINIITSWKLEVTPQRSFNF